MFSKSQRFQDLAKGRHFKSFTQTPNKKWSSFAKLAPTTNVNRLWSTGSLSFVCYCHCATNIIYLSSHSLFLSACTAAFYLLSACIWFADKTPGPGDYDVKLHKKAGSAALFPKGQRFSDSSGENRHHGTSIWVLARCEPDWCVICWFSFAYPESFSVLILNVYIKYVIVSLCIIQVHTPISILHWCC